MWKHDLENGLRLLRLAIDTHLITSHFALPLLIREPGGLVVEMTDGTRDYNAEHYQVTEANWRDGAATNPHFAAISESPRFVGRAVAALAADPQFQRRNGGSFSSGGLAREYDFTDLDGSRPDCWRYIVEVQDAGPPSRPDRLPLNEGPQMAPARRSLEGFGPVFVPGRVTISSTDFEARGARRPR